MSTGIREKFPRKFTYFVHKNLPFMSTRIFPPYFQGGFICTSLSTFKVPKSCEQETFSNPTLKSAVLLNCICSTKQPQNIWKDITMKEMTSSNQTSFSLNLKSFFKRAFGAATDKINNKSFVQCLVQENLLLVILSNLTALYAWQCSDAFHLLSRGFHLYLSELAFIN